MRPGAVSGGGAGSPVRAARAGRLPAAAARSETRRAGRGAGPLSPALCRLPGPPPPGPGPRPGPGPGQRRDRGDPDPRRREVRVRARTGRTGPAGPRGTGGQGGRSRAGHDTRREPEPESRVRVREDGPRAGVGDRDARPGRGPAWAPRVGSQASVRGQRWPAPSRPPEPGACPCPGCPCVRAGCGAPRCARSGRVRGVAPAPPPGWKGGRAGWWARVGSGSGRGRASRPTRMQGGRAALYALVPGRSLSEEADAGSHRSAAFI